MGLESSKRNSGVKQLRAVLVLGAILLLAFVIRLGTISNHGVWIDETWVVTTPNFHLDSDDIFPKFFKYPQIQRLSETNQEILKKIYDIHPVFQICLMLTSDMHPPFYYIASYAWTRFFGESLYSIRFLPLLFGLLTILITFHTAKVLFGERAALMASLFLSVSPIHVHFSQLARNYSLMTLLIALSYLLLFTKVIKKFDLKYVVLYCFTLFLAMLTHYYSVFFVLTQILIIGLSEVRGEKRFLRWVAVFAIVGILYFPWLPVVFVQIFVRNPTLQSHLQSANVETMLSQLYAIGFTPSLRSISLSFDWVCVVKIVNILMSFSLLLFVIIQSRSVSRNALHWIFLWGFVPIILLFALSFIKPLYSVKSLLPIVPAFCILYAFALARITRKSIRYVVLGLLAGAMFISQLTWPTYPGIESTEDTRGAVSEMKSHIEPESFLAVHPFFYRDGLWYYLKKDIAKWDETVASNVNRDKDIWLFRYWDSNDEEPAIGNRLPDSVNKFLGLTVYFWKKRF
jgi:hypothetical protein